MKLIKLMAIVVVLIFLAGCKGSGGGGTSAQYNFKQGITELQLTQLENAPPEKVYPNSVFKIVVNVDNQAAYPVERGVVRIIGLDQKYFSFSVLEQNFATLIGRSLTAPQGEKVYLEFEGESKNLFQNEEQRLANYYLQTEYGSYMDFSDTVCLNPNLYEVYDAGCKINTKKSYSGQGAPLAVTEMEEIITPGANAGVEFRLKLKNAGQGRVKSITLLKTARLGNDELFCYFKGKSESIKKIELKQKEQEATLICKKPLTDMNSYETTLIVSFEYEYEYKEQHKMTIIR